MATKVYDLEDRTLAFAKRIDVFVLKLPKTTTNIEHGKQLVRSGSSVGANYIEANESLGKKDFLMRIRISRKEAKESRYWLDLTSPGLAEMSEKDLLIKESTELIKIFSSILEKYRNST